MRGDKGSWNFLKIRVVTDLREHLKTQCVPRGKANEQIRGSADAGGERDVCRSPGSGAAECQASSKEKPGKFRAKDGTCVNPKWEAIKNSSSTPGILC